jgi:NAD-dependent SIR2 family protein deacetylase
MNDATISAARAALEGAEALVVAAGAGMGVDSGLPDFRGNEGFWNAYPPFKSKGLKFTDLANPQWFDRDPSLAWGFYGHRKNLYRETNPHDGFRMLLELGARLPKRYFVFTSNVDGQFFKAGYNPQRVCEAHGSIHHLQCTRRSCDSGIWRSEAPIDVDHDTMTASEPFPRCPSCGSLARPNILMFGDAKWRSERTDAQEVRLSNWLDTVSPKKLVIVELGAGGAIPTVRHFSEQNQRWGAKLIRINPRESDGPEGTLSFAEGALSGLNRIFRRNP